jgi:hypothetical protein
MSRKRILSINIMVKKITTINLGGEREGKKKKKRWI